jgi:hypothetical protein
VTRATIVSAWLLVAAAMPAGAQPQDACRVICAPDFKVEPTITFSNLFGGPRVEPENGAVAREPREAAFEVILSMGLPTRVRWLDFTVEAIVMPLDRDATPEIEFEANLTWLPGERTGGWVSSHLDVVDKFSAAERPADRRAYTHKLNFELDTAVAIFNWLPEGRWLRGVELEGSLDYVATGLPRRGDVVDGMRYLDDASAWSFSVVVVIPVAP